MGEQTDQSGGTVRRTERTDEWGRTLVRIYRDGIKTDEWIEEPEGSTDA